jgi:hypothetical protein
MCLQLGRQNQQLGKQNTFIRRRNAQFQQQMRSVFRLVLCPLRTS